ncbi:hypothetical protein K2Z84_34575 [Candidatus Binatia bacterium]|nr:hypothetical protein [Candidatus Binatia bacterium]
MVRGAVVLLACATGAVLLPVLATSARAQIDPPGRQIDVAVNYVYAAQLGFGTYHVGGLSVNVYSLPLAYTLSDVLLDWRLKVEFPILYGGYSFRRSVEVEELDNARVKIFADQRTLGAEPKLRLEIPILEPWTVSLIGAWGFGSTFDTEISYRLPDGRRVRDREAEQDVWFYTYQVGVSSLLQHRIDRLTLGLGNAFIYAGTANLERAPSAQAYGAVETGVEARHPLGFDVNGYDVDGSLFFIWYWFTPSLQFSRVEKRSLEVDDVYEVGLSFGADQATPFEIPVLGNPRLGVSYRAGNDLDALRVNFGFPF